MAQYGKSIVFGAEVGNIQISLQVEASGLEELLSMIEIAANVEIAEIGKNSYTVKTFSEAQRIRDSANAEKDRELLAEKAQRELESEKQRSFNDTLNRLKGTEVRMFDVKFVEVGDLEQAIQEVLGDDFKDVVRVKSLSVGGVRNYSSVLVSAPNREIIDRVGELIKSIDREKPLIEIEALFVEVTLNDQDELGLEWSLLPNALEYHEIPVQLNSSMGDLFEGRYLGRFVRTTEASVSAQLRQLAESGKGRVLSNTKIRTMSGRKSYFTSETQEPIMSLNGDSEVQVDYKNVGISLEALATVLDDNSIYMKVIPRSSSIVGEKVLQDSIAPQIAERRVEAEVILNPDETMVISGLLYDRDSTTRTRVPVLSSIPLVGELFKSTEKRHERSQIFIYLRPRLVSVKTGASGDSEADEEISEIWSRYSKLSGAQAADMLDPRSRKDGAAAAPSEEKAAPVPVPGAQDVSKAPEEKDREAEVREMPKAPEKESGEAQARKERAESEDAARVARIKELESQTGIRLRRRSRTAAEVEDEFRALAERYR
jgi:type II secretory pathway component GspD/PulD (secretin)